MPTTEENDKVRRQKKKICNEHDNEIIMRIRIKQNNSLWLLWHFNIPWPNIVVSWALYRVTMCFYYNIVTTF